MPKSDFPLCVGTWVISLIITQGVCKVAVFTLPFFMTESSCLILEHTLQLDLHSYVRTHNNSFPLNRAGHDDLHLHLP